MSKRYRNIIFIDTEFVSAKKIRQPIQISLIAYKIKGNEFCYDKSYSTYILLEKGAYLNRYVKAFTGIDDEILWKNGVLLREAREQLMSFLQEFSINNTLIAGWDISNDIAMFNILLNRDGEIFDINNFDWYDVVIPYKHFYFNESANTPSLESACQKLELSTAKFHDSYADAFSTGQVMQKLVYAKSFGVLMQPIYQRERMTNMKKKEKVAI